MSSAYTLILKNVKQETLNLIFLNILIYNIGVASLYIVNCATMCSFVLGKTTSKLVNTDTFPPDLLLISIHNKTRAYGRRKQFWVYVLIRLIYKLHFNKNR